jgi:hypothetical protein
MCRSYRTVILVSCNPLTVLALGQKFEIIIHSLILDGLICLDNLLLFSLHLNGKLQCYSLDWKQSTGHGACFVPLVRSFETYLLEQSISGEHKHLDGLGLNRMVVLKFINARQFPQTVHHFDSISKKTL